MVRLVSNRELAEDREAQDALGHVRPAYLHQFVGQEALVRNLLVYIQAAQKRGEPLDHVLFYGPPGLGKTTLAAIIAHELGTKFRPTSGSALARTGDLAAILTSLETGTVFFIDEIHRLNPVVEEMLYPAMEGQSLDIVLGEGPAAKTIRLRLNPFTLVGATTRTGLITRPLRERFGIPLALDFYTEKDLTDIILRQAQILEAPIEHQGALAIAKRARGTPRIAGRLLRRVRDFALVESNGVITENLADQTLQHLKIEADGLDALDLRYMHMMATHYGGGPVGLETLSAVLSFEHDVLENIIEPFLMRKAYLKRTARGRVLTETGWHRIGKLPPQPRTLPLLRGEAKK